MENKYEMIAINLREQFTDHCNALLQICESPNVGIGRIMSAINELGYAHRAMTWKAPNLDPAFQQAVDKADLDSLFVEYDEKLRAIYTETVRHGK